MKYSSLPRIYTNLPLKTNATILLDKENSHYLEKVIRVRKGEDIRIFNLPHGEFIASIKEYGAKNGALILLSENIRDIPVMNHGSVTAGISLIKSEKLILSITAATALGVSAIKPLIADRSQYQTIKEDRIIKAIEEASIQSERMNFPELLHAEKLASIDYSAYDLILMINENERTRLLPDLGYKEYKGKNILVLIGPEGGWTEDETKLIQKHNFISISLGNQVLRSEIATISTLSWILLSKSF
jgi:16S rRNA (uracil1498-N3)-methyltransferase